MSINLEEKISILYDFLYNITLRTCYNINHINIKNIKTSDIIIKYGKYSNSLLKQLLLGNFKFFYENNNTLFYSRYTNQFSTLIKISLDKKSYNDSLISYILSELVFKKKIKHILLPILNFEININDLKSILNLKINNKFSNLLEKKINKICYVSIREHFFKINTLKNYCLTNDIKWSIAIFNILYTLLIIKKTYPNFQHNMLILDNIIVYENETLATTYNYNNKKYNIPTIPYELKICNFENSILDFEHNINNKLEEIDEIEEIDETTVMEARDTIEELDETNGIEGIEGIEGIKRKITKEKIYNKNLIDLIILATNILSINKKIDLETKNFLNKIIEYKKMKNYSLENILEDSYFSEFVVNEQKNMPLLQGKRELISNFSIKLENNSENILGYQNKLESSTRKLKLSTNKLKSSTRKLKSEVEAEVESEGQDINYSRQIKLVGGANTVPPYKTEKNSPFVSNDQTNTFKKKAAENPVREPPLLLEQKIYDTNKNIQPRPEPPPPYVPVYDSVGQVISGLPQLGQNPAYTAPFQKVYNISLSNPLGNMSTINSVYEDILPGDPRILSFKSIHERMELIKWMRNIMIELNDGEDMNIAGGKNSLLSFIKLLNFNPYSITENPLKELPLNFMLFNAAYPIRYDNIKHNLSVAKQASGINVRLYNLTLGEMQADQINSNITKESFDIWREIIIYDYIKNKIVRTNQSPNFITSILYKIDSKSTIDWQKLAISQKKINNNNNNNNNNTINELHTLEDFTSVFSLKKNIILKLYYINNNRTFIDQLKNKLVNEPNIEIIFIDKLNSDNTAFLMTHRIITFPSILLEYNGKITVYKDVHDIGKIIEYINTNIFNKKKLDITISSGKTLLLVTEAPTTSFIKWASPIYEKYGSIKKMIATGYHIENVWKSILFQIMYILTVLQKHDIYFQELSLATNFYIKDLFSDTNNLTYWIYTINEVDYYIPNYGYLVVFDSKYSDINKEILVATPKTIPDIKDKEYKIYASQFTNNGNIDTTMIKSLIYSKFKDIMNPRIFYNIVKLAGGLMPTEDIMKLIESIHNDAPPVPVIPVIPPVVPDIPSIASLFITYFPFFLHNRIGTLLLRTEKEIINKMNRPTFKASELLIWEKRYDEYEWVLFINDPTTPTLGPISYLKNILIKENSKYISKQVNSFSLYTYPEIIQPDKITTENIIEKYNL